MGILSDQTWVRARQSILVVAQFLVLFDQLFVKLDAPVLFSLVFGSFDAFCATSMSIDGVDLEQLVHSSTILH